MGEARGKLIHYHIFKNSGSSVDALLSRYFGKDHVCIEGDSPNDVMSSKRLFARLQTIGDFKAVSTHLGRPGPELSEYIPVIFLRDPIDRARSVYRFIQQDATQPEHAALAHLSFRDFVDGVLTRDEGGSIIGNYQTMHLSDASFREDVRVGELELRQALALLSSWPVVGVARQFSLSLRRFNVVYGARFPGLFIRGPHVNATKAGYISDHHEWTEARLELGPALFNRLLEENALDLALHQWAVNRLAEPDELDFAVGG